MIAGLLHSGSGLGDQLFRLITVRTLAQDKGFDYAMIGEFKGNFFLNQPNIIGEFAAPYIYNEKDLRDSLGNDVRSFDPESQFIVDNTIVDGSFEDSKYWGHNLENINKWLAVEPLDVPDDLCVIGFRGGEYASNPDLFLEPDYWYKARQKMGDDKDYEVHTDDPKLAAEFFPSTRVIENSPISHSKHSNMGYNWRAMRHAKYAIIPNSAFFILPRLLKHLEDPTAITIAPRYWARHNRKIWARPACYYKPFTYIHAEDTYKTKSGLEK